MMTTEHDFGCDEQHTARQRCNANASVVAAAAPAAGSAEMQPPERREAEPARRADAAALMPTAGIEPPEQMFGPDVDAHGAGLADGPLESIDTSRLPTLPLLGLVLVAIVSIAVAWRLVRGQR
ncbi:MAG: hypothetical protein IVW36_08340 [Dehalococcoidia bacterium]|nr:hypothetical protein [Dehalococcoidia bacterium]